MKLDERIQSEMNKALKEREELKVSLLRFLLAEVRNREIELNKRGKLTDEEIAQVIRTQVKKHQESIEAYRAGRREDLAKKEEAELQILNTYLPQSLTSPELEKIILETVKEIGAKGAKDFGKVMGAVMVKVKGRADGQEVAALVRKLI
jgi:uncharacterized protein YqeY